MEVGKLAVGNRRGKRAYKLGRWIDGDRKGVATGGWDGTGNGTGTGRN